MAIYTKRGDRGETSIFDKNTGNLTSVSKRSCKIRAVGAIDELNSFLGIVGVFCEDKELIGQIREVQGNLFTMNSILAGGNLRFPEIRVRKLEKQIDKWEGDLPVIKNFVYYGGSEDASLIFHSRALARRAERSLVSLSKKQVVKPILLEYLNRLSDYLFMMARFLNSKKGEKEVFWKGKKK
jgi:cob(I)alamin adenosyltransferase